MLRIFLISWILSVGISWQVVAFDYPDTLQQAIIKVYKEIDDVQLALNIIYPENYFEGEQYPAIIFFFGGGWQHGTVKQFEPHSRYLAKRGLISVIADYRVKSRHGTKPVDAVKDAKSAIRFIRKNAVQLGIDPDQIIAAGGSAGGHLAASAAILRHINDKSDDLSINAVPDALILFNPVLDTKEDRFRQLMDDPEALSPLHHVTKDLPPAIIFHGTDDNVVPFSSIREFEEKMEEKGNYIEVHAYDGQGHAFFNYGRSDNKYFISTVYHSDKFLKSFGFVEGEPAIKPGISELKLNRLVK